MSTPTIQTPTIQSAAGVATAVGAAAEMATIHTAFRRELRLAPALLRSVRQGDRLRAGVICAHLDLFDRFLHHHHTIEDELVWPKLLERVPDELAPIVELMETQHHGVASLLERTAPMRAAWRASADCAVAEELATIYAQLHDELLEHLDTEEQHVMPLVEACITKKEWAAICKAAQRGGRLKDGPKTLGMLAYDGDPEVMLDLLSTVPGPMRKAVLSMGRRAYGKHAQRVYGTPTP